MKVCRLRRPVRRPAGGGRRSAAGRLAPRSVAPPWPALPVRREVVGESWTDLVQPAGTEGNQRYPASGRVRRAAAAATMRLRRDESVRDTMFEPRDPKMCGRDPGSSDNKCAEPPRLLREYWACRAVRPREKRGPLLRLRPTATILGHIAARHSLAAVRRQIHVLHTPFKRRLGVCVCV